MHMPIYSSNQAHYMEGESMRTVFEGWFVCSKVDFIFAGHVHAYERSVRNFFPFYVLLLDVETLRNIYFN
jgi:hypothetical protein